jgi:hypothetical protein
VGAVGLVTLLLHPRLPKTLSAEQIDRMMPRRSRPTTSTGRRRPRA